MLTQESLTTSTTGIGVAALGILAIAYRWMSKRNERVPPGPPRYPVIGNLLNFPMQRWNEIFPEWHRRYGAHNCQSSRRLLTKSFLVSGDIVYANLTGMPVFVVGSHEVAEELLNVRGRISAGRPSNVLVTELCVALPTWKLIIIDKPRPGWAGTNGVFH